MSDAIKHECGLAFIRLLKPLDFYHKKYGTALYGLNKLQLLLQKQRNRGQDGAGLATIKLDPQPGNRYISIKRSVTTNYLADLFKEVSAVFKNLKPNQLNDPQWLKENMPYMGELLLGHLRYGTHGDNSIHTCHPFLRQNNWISRNLVLAGNFNMTNVDELFNELVQLGQYPKRKSDTVTVMEKIGHFLDDEVQRLFNWHKPDGYTNQEINNLIFDNLDVKRMLRRASKKFDGGFVIAGMIGHGDAFVIRDPGGIRPAFYYKDDEIVAAASERPALQTTLNVHISKIKELKRGHALIVKKSGKVSEKRFMEPQKRTACSFERIYFSRGTDRDIYLERKQLGRQLTASVLKAVDYDIDNTVFSFVPNTAESAFYGLVEGLEEYLNNLKHQQILEKGSNIKPKKLKKILDQRIRTEKTIVKDAKLRTFIADDATRGEMISHVYDATYGLIENEKDNLVLLDDSIVRGATLHNSIIKIAARLRPKRIIIVSSAPQIRYPDCYGIDMSKLGNFAAFKALIALLEEHKKEKLIKATYKACKKQLQLPKEQMTNPLQNLYNEFSYETVSDKIAKMVTPADIKPRVDVIYQTIEGLHKACPHNNGDWYFSGNYPTPGGFKVVNRSFVNYVEKRDERAY